MARAKKAPTKQQPSTRVLRPRTSKAKQPSPKLTTLHPRPRRSIKKQEPSPSSTSSKTFTSPVIVCDCAIKRTEIHQGCFECQQCRNAQDPDCVLPNESFREAGGGLAICNNCKVFELRQQITAQERNLATLTRMIRQRRTELHKFCATTLWIHYCNLPDGRSSNAVISMAGTAYDARGILRPVHEAPENWVEEVKSRLTKMTKDADARVLSIVLGRNGRVKCSYLGDLIQWREIAKWMLHHGAYKGRTAKAALGILAEVLGLEEKGTVWDGGYLNGFLSPVSELRD